MAEKDQSLFVDYLKEHIGEKIFVLCVRYSYRGILSAVGPSHILLANSTAVEEMGPANTDRPRSEDPIGSTICIKSDAIELVFQPRCCLAPLPGEDGYQANAQNR